MSDIDTDTAPDVEGLELDHDADTAEQPLHLATTPAATPIERMARTRVARRIFRQQARLRDQVRGRDLSANGEPLGASSSPSEEPARRPGPRFTPPDLKPAPLPGRRHPADVPGQRASAAPPAPRSAWWWVGLWLALVAAAGVVAAVALALGAHLS